jgi:quinol monooxygenase YgiN
MYVVTVELVIRAEQVADFRAAITENARISCRQEPGCRQFDVCIAPEDPRVVFLYEVYVDRAAFDAHLESAHFKAFDSRVAAWVESKTIRTFRRADAA